MPKSSNTGSTITVPNSPTVPSLKPTPKVKHKPIKKKRGANSNYYLARILEKGMDNLTTTEKQDLALLVKSTHRIKPIVTSKAKQGKTVFNSVTGHHEWLPTDRALEILGSTGVWAGLYTSMRSPTWLLVVNPVRYCIDLAAYGKAIQLAAGHVVAKNGQMVPASSLGLVGHSGGLCLKGTQLTTFQSTWHDELRDLYDKHAATNAYDAYWLDLSKFIGDNFLFVNSPMLPLGNANVQGVSNDDVMKAIAWDLELSGRGNPAGVPMSTMYDVAQYLHAQWATWNQLLANSFRAWRG